MINQFVGHQHHIDGVGTRIDTGWRHYGDTYGVTTGVFFDLLVTMAMLIPKK